MLFNSYSFLFLFFPAALAGYYLCRKAGEGVKNSYLIAVSFVFYSWTTPQYLPVLIAGMAVNYGFGWWIERARHPKLTLTAGLTFNLGLLGCFKYLDTAGFVPPGISFFTFTQIAYLMECYRGNLKGTGALSYGVYVGWFPKMMQGPIALPGEFLLQLEKKSVVMDWEAAYRNLYLFVLGLFKKVLIADTFGKAVDLGYASLTSLNSWDGIIVMLSYTLQLYFDFSGYCDMAMGISGMFGITLPLNFDSPYKAANILEFWKGWHRTLTAFFTKYLYIPLGGNRKGRGRTYLNCLIVFFLSGIWHGSGLTFIVWGMMHGVLYVLTRAFKESGIYSTLSGRLKRTGHLMGRFRHGISVLLTFLYVNAAWVFFRAPSIEDAGMLLKTIFSFQGGRVNRELAGCFNLDEFWYVIKILHLDRWQYAHYILMVVILIAVLLLVFFGKNAVNYVGTVKPGFLHAVFITVLFVWSVLSLSGVSSFLYVNF